MTRPNYPDETMGMLRRAQQGEDRLLEAIKAKDAQIERLTSELEAIREHMTDGRDEMTADTMAEHVESIDAVLRSVGRLP